MTDSHRTLQAIVNDMNDVSWADIERLLGAIRDDLVPWAPGYGTSM